MQEPFAMTELLKKAMRSSIEFLIEFLFRISRATKSDKQLSKLSEFEAHINKLDNRAKWAVQDWIATDNGRTIAEAIKSGTAIAVSDGSYKNNFGTAAFVIEGTDSNDRVEAVMIVPGSDMGSHRSELAGLYGITVMVSIICRIHNIAKGSIVVGCDSQSALREVLENDDLPQRDIDLIVACRQWKAASPIRWTTHHIPAHQDKDKMKELNRWAKLNCEMDRKATVKREIVELEDRQTRLHGIERARRGAKMEV
jgi:hypothetical protein